MEKSRQRPHLHRPQRLSLTTLRNRPFLLNLQHKNKRITALSHQQLGLIEKTSVNSIKHEPSDQVNLKQDIHYV